VAPHEEGEHQSREALDQIEPGGPSTRLRAPGKSGASITVESRVFMRPLFRRWVANRR
jgi:hypothetical protein